MLCHQSEGLDVLSEKNIINFDNFGPQGRSCSTRSYNALNTPHSGIPEQQQHYSNNKINNNSNNNNNNNTKNNNNSNSNNNHMNLSFSGVKLQDYAQHSSINLGQTSAVFPFLGAEFTSSFASLKALLALFCW